MRETTTLAVKERPILFAGDLVRKILAGTKAGTRRPVMPQPERHGDRMRWCPPGAKYVPAIGGWAPCSTWDASRPVMETGAAGIVAYCPLGKPGDRLWVRETWRTFERPEDGVDGVLFQADGAFQPIENTREAAERWIEADHLKPRPDEYKPIKCGTKGLSVATPRRAKGWRPSIFMPRWASRITLEVAGVRVERVQDLTRAEAEREGFRQVGAHDPVACFRDSWDQFYGRRGLGWDRNPFIWVVSFRRVDGEVASA